MTRKDYLLIAEVLRVQRYRAELEITHAEEFDKEFACGCAEGADSAAMELCDSLHRDNPRFDRAHFLAVVRGEKELTSKPDARTEKCKHIRHDIDGSCKDCGCINLPGSEY